MAKKMSQGSFDMEEFKKQMSQLKDAAAQSKKEYEDKKANGEVTKQPLGQKIIGIILLIAIVVGVGFALWDSLDTILLPKNSITIVVTDQNGEAISGLKVNLQVNGHIFDEEFTDISDVTILGAQPGDYMLTFDEIPEGYSCPELVDTFTLKQDSKIKVEYECVKEN